MKRKYLLHFLILALILTTMPFAAFADSQQVFKDLPSSHWAYAEVMEAYESGRISGYKDGTFRPGSLVTHAEFLRMVVSATVDFEPEPSKTSLWYENYLDVAIREKFFSLFKKEKFIELANRPIDRGIALRIGADAVVYKDLSFLLDRYGDLTKIPMDLNKKETPKYIDFGNYVFTPAVEYALKSGLMVGYNTQKGNEFRPSHSITRAEAIVVAARIRDNSKRVKLTLVDLDKYVDDIIYYTNLERTKAGLSTLVKDQILCEVAYEKSKEMVELGYFAHLSPVSGMHTDVLDSRGYKYKVAGENLAYGYEPGYGVVQGWMNSPGHKENMLYPQFTHIGIGVYYKGKTPYITQILARPK